MTPARLQTIEGIFRAALDQKPEQLSAFLDTACEGDELLCRKVKSLVASHHGAGNFIATSAVALATKIIENEQADSLVGQTIGHYKVSRRIGTGGMGEVYLATDITAGRKAALKLLPARFTGDAERLKRFQQEARAVVALNHPNILTVYEIGEDHSTHYIASELIEGETLRQRSARGAMQLSEVVDVAIQVTSALAAAHQAAIVHRDIKPENIMLRPDGYVKVLDFGIAKLAEQEVPVTIPTDEALLLVETNLGSILGTVRYMSPEQARGAPVDQRTDIWSFGVVVYEMVTGHAPFTGETPGEAMHSILETEPPPLTRYIPQIPAEVQQIINKTLRKDRDERYQSANELLEALQSLRRRMEFKAELKRSRNSRESCDASAEGKREIQLEIAHVLFIDIVGYSNFSIDDQHAAIEELNQIVLASAQVRGAEAAGPLIKIPTGDGIALVFYTSPEAPVQCAVEISSALKEHSRLQLRMGIHSGPVSGVVDVNERANLAGAGLNIAQRVMDCGDAGHILLSKHAAEDLQEYERWRPFLHDLGSCEVKHGARISVVNLYDDQIGNGKLPQRFEAAHKRKTRLRWAAMTAVLLALALTFAGTVMVSRNRVSSTVPAPEKSIAVLPFENRSEDKANAYFADGIQDEILTRLSKIADLKVISRVSTQHYKSAPENLPEIARQLGVAHVLEGSVQKSGDAVRVTVQLIKAANDSHIWADSFDRKLTDIFSVESEVAKAIADQLQVKLTGREEQEITAKPTNNPEAYDAYLRGLAYSLKAQNSPANSLGAQKHLREAVRLDPKFALAWALLSYTDSFGYIGITLQATDSLREEARHGVETALTLQPNLGEGLIAKGYYYYAYLKDYPGAVRYFEQARPFLPNSSRIPECLAYVARRAGQWEQSELFFNQAERLDPRNVTQLSQHALSYVLRRRFPDAVRKLDQVLNITPDDVDTVGLKASIAQAEGDLPRASAILGPLHPTADHTGALETQVYQAILERRPDQVIPRLKEILVRPDPAMGYFNGELRFWLGWAQQVGGDHAAAQESWRQARSELEPFLKDQSDNYNLMQDLALVEMSLGNKAAALSMAERAIATNPIEKDVVDGPAPLEIFARVAAQAGEPDRAIATLQKLLSIPYEGALPNGNAPLTPALLRLDPMFDPLRNDPRFEKLCSGSTLAAPEKSIAVLPFENLSEEKANAYFADGIQDEILTRLSKIADLKVISRTSTQHYKSAPKNLSEIARQLGVAHILEGSVQKSGNAVRVNVQLIKAANDSHVWAESFDRELTDIFVVERNVAKAIAEQLRVHLSGDEEQVIAAKPTDNPEAYDAYLRGLAFEARSHAPSWFTSPDLVWNAIGFYKQAVQLDPDFTVAWGRLSRMDAFLYFNPVDPTTAVRRDEAQRALDNAQKLEPNSPETLLALGYNQYWVLRDYGRAKSTFGRVRKMLPSSSEVPRALGLISRREGHWDQSLAYFEQALTVDPRNVELLMTAAETYGMLRQFATALKLYDRALDIAPGDPDVMAGKASIYQAQGNLREAAGLLSEVNAQAPAEETFHIKITQLRLERNYGECVRLLQARQAQFHFNSQYEKALNPVWLALMQRVASDTAGAKLSVEQARNTLEPLYRDQPDNFVFAASLSQAYAVMKEKDLALQAAEHAIALLPTARDRVSGPSLEQNLAFIQTVFGESSRAISTLTRLLEMPYGSWLYDPVPITPALLRLDPIWDPLRADPAFQELVASASK